MSRRLRQTARHGSRTIEVSPLDQSNPRIYSMEYVKPEIISLKNSSEYNEKWLQSRIEEDPSILGIGELDFRDSEKILLWW